MRINFEYIINWMREWVEKRARNYKACREHPSKHKFISKTGKGAVII
jgi:hypothetical protein